MASNRNMTDARAAKNDEFYTRLEDIEREMPHYREHFKGKTIFLNCDDPDWSNFWRYFDLNFDFLGIRRLISTHFDANEATYMQEITRDASGRRSKVSRTPLTGNGDFRSPEAIELLKQSDIVVTNPPFSLFREYVSQLVEFGKSFIIIGNMNAVTYKEVWGNIVRGEAWLGVTSPKSFRLPEGAPEKSGQYTDEGGHRYQTFGNICWFTNLDHARRHEKVALFREYDPQTYPKYDRYDAINVSKVADIPRDYLGYIGVPVSFLGRHSSEQFEIIDANTIRDESKAKEKPHGLIKDGDGAVNGKPVYARMVIRRVS